MSKLFLNESFYNCDNYLIVIIAHWERDKGGNFGKISVITDVNGSIQVANDASVSLESFSVVSGPSVTFVSVKQRCQKVKQEEHLLRLIYDGPITLQPRMMLWLECQSAISAATRIAHICLL